MGERVSRWGLGWQLTAMPSLRALLQWRQWVLLRWRQWALLRWRQWPLGPGSMV